MSLDFVIFIFFYFFAIFSTLGYGLIIEKIFRIEKYNLNIGFIGLIGVLFLITYSYASNYILPHDLYHNVIINILGIIFFVFNINSKKKEFIILSIIFTILLISFFLFKTHDDFPYYHFPYTYHITQNATVFGLGELNHGYKTPSSIFFLNSLFYLPIIKYNLFQIGASLFYGFSILILFLDIKKNLKLKEIDPVFFLRLFSLAFILVFFYRIQEHGTDRSAQILSFLFVIELFNLKKNYINFNLFLSKTIILLTLIIGLKLFFLLYLVFILPLIYYLKKDFKLNLLKNLLNNKFFYLSVISFVFYISIYFANTGCLFFPVSFSCFENVSWSIDVDRIKAYKLHYENWAKAGSGAGYENDDPLNYVKSLSWVPNWIDKYFFNKVSDFILGTIFLVIFFICFFCRQKNELNQNKFDYKFFYFVIIFLFLEWFYNHPALRYGGYSIIALLFFIPFSYFINKFKSLNKIHTKVISIIIISFLVFFFRNVARIDKEVKQYKYDIFNEPYYYLDQSHFRLQKVMDELIINHKNCKINESMCITKEGPQRIIERYGKYIITRKNVK